MKKLKFTTQKCPICLEFVGVPSTVCNCSHLFVCVTTDHTKRLSINGFLFWSSFFKTSEVDIQIPNFLRLCYRKTNDIEDADYVHIMFGKD